MKELSTEDQIILAARSKYPAKQTSPGKYRFEEIAEKLAGKKITINGVKSPEDITEEDYPTELFGNLYEASRPVTEPITGDTGKTEDQE